MNNAGMFNKRITIQGLASGEPVRDEDGYPIEGSTSDINISVWSMVKTVSAREFSANKTTNSELTIRFIIRYRKDINTDMTILYKGQSYEIDSIINDNEEDKTLTIIAKLVI